MKGRDKRRRAKSRQNANTVPLDRLRRCKVKTALVDENTCNAEQRIQKNQKPNGCTECPVYISLRIHCELMDADVHPSICEAGRDELSCAGCGQLLASR